MRFQDVRLKGLGTGLLGAGLLGLVLGTCGTAKAQDAREDAKPAQQEQPKDEAKPAQPKDDTKAAKPGKEQETPKAEEGKPAKNDKQDDKRNSEMKPTQDQNRPVQNNDRAVQNNDRPAQNNDRAMQNNGGDHARPSSGQQGQRIPDDKFRSNFGRQHTFRVQTQVVEGQPRFQYSGYSFALANPWPAGWAYTDDCYIDYIDGEYVLIDLLHPGVQLTLIVVE
jgi:hypothetical protein